MDSATWQRLEHLFCEAVELPESQRADFCDRGCADDPRLREELRSLLKAHEDTRGVLDRPPGLAKFAAGPGHETLSEGTRIGVWRIGAPSNRGGAGEVYYATRVDGGFDQLAALKRLCRETAPDLVRFHSERTILAGLEHPGIARLLDGGVAGAAAEGAANDRQSCAGVAALSRAPGRTGTRDLTLTNGATT